MCTLAPGYGSKVSRWAATRLFVDGNHALSIERCLPTAIPAGTPATCASPQICVQAVAIFAPPEVSVSLQQSGSFLLAWPGGLLVMQTTTCTQPQRKYDWAAIICRPAPDHSSNAARRAAACGHVSYPHHWPQPDFLQQVEVR